MNEQQRGWNSAYSGRAARSMNQAFGPYCDDKLAPMADPYQRAHWVMYVLAVVAIVVIVYFAKP